MPMTVSMDLDGDGVSHTVKPRKSGRPSSKVVRFTEAQKITLNSYYKAGMKGVGLRHLNAIPIEKVKVSAICIISILVPFLSELDQEKELQNQPCKTTSNTQG